MTRSIFYGFGAVVGSLNGVTTAGFWPGDPIALQWDHAKLIPVDLAMNPQAVRTGAIQPADIQVDDHVTNSIPGLTRIGPMWPDGTTIGACWLESTYWDKLSAGTKAPRIPTGAKCQAYELTSILYWDGPHKHRRFCGFHAEIVQEAGRQALCQIWHPGQSGTAPTPAGAWWLDLDAVAHPQDPDFPTIGVGAAAKTGALYLDTSSINSLAMRTPKLPWYLGADYFPIWS